MKKTVRFSISLDSDLLKQVDSFVADTQTLSRSKLITDLLSDHLIKHNMQNVKQAVVGTILIVFSHKQRELSFKLTDIQHTFHDCIISSQHIHMNHDLCLEIIVVKGKAQELSKLVSTLQSQKGVKHATIQIASDAHQ